MSDFIEVNADLHLHGLYSAAVSGEMVPRKIGEQAPLKGLHLVGTGDILNERWINLLKEQLKQTSDSMFEHANGTKFVLQTEIEDNNRVHHIILFPSLSKVYEAREKMKKFCKNLDTDGRPKIWLNGEELAEICAETGCLLGPSHMFTPYFGLYSKYNSYKDCYGKYWNRIYFGELGLSADTDMADKIEELRDITFLSNSDCHSPWPNKLGREFTRFQMKDISFEELEKAIKREGGRKPVLNIKFDPREGKYHKTRCAGCLLFFKPEEAAKFNWRCPECGKPIKKGVDFRIYELSRGAETSHPEHRPKTVHIIPLSEIIAVSLGIKQSWSLKVQEQWKLFASKFGSEITALVDAPVEKLAEVDKKTAELVRAFREGKFSYIPGGAGVYGIPVPPGKKAEVKYFENRQSSLEDFSRKR
ncbi:MAG: TIGR00375 family protein [Nanoarchaeota archaeon]|nr:TIGR00375 family protein [Nanoarchaeota archaeon]